MAGRKKTKSSNRGEGSFRKTTSGMLEYRFSYKDPNTGKPRRKSFTGEDEKECLDKADRWKQKVERDRNGIDTEATIVDILKNRYQIDYEMNHLEEAVKIQKRNPNDLLFYDNITDSVITTSQVNCYFRRVCMRANIPVRGQHSLRHTFATRCIESGIPPVVLKTWLGHKDIHVTLDTYTDVFREMDHGAVEKLDQYIDAM